MDFNYHNLITIAQEIEVRAEEPVEGGIGQADQVAQRNGVGVLLGKFLNLKSVRFRLHIIKTTTTVI